MNKLSNKYQKMENRLNVYGLSGLMNTGNTCYMNSAIQAISNLYYLRNYLLKNAHKIFSNAEEKISPYITAIENNMATNLNKMNDLSLPQNIRDGFLKKYNESKKKYDILLERVNKWKNFINISHHDNNLSVEEQTKILNNTMTFRILCLLKGMWKKNSNIKPTSFRYVFSEINNYFDDNNHHDAEEAYSYIIRQMQEELNISTNIRIRTVLFEIDELMKYKNDINATHNIEEKKRLIESYDKMKKSMSNESRLALDSYKEMKKYYSNYSKITEIFTSFMHLNRSCPLCDFQNHNFESFLHLPLSIPDKQELNIYDCFNELCKTEILDENNLWNCGNCKQYVKGMLKTELWTNPIVLVIQIKRFDFIKMRQNNALITYPLENLDISPFLSKIKHSNINFSKYNLQSVICHTGEMTSGHYYTYAKNEDTNIWYEFNDQIIREIPMDRIQTNFAYILTYVKNE